MNPSDQLARDRFATELDRNFSVVASAGSGKTTAITQRILAIAQSRDATEILPRLVVVTFANRSADEMQQRTRQLLLEKNLGEEIQTAFNRAFFGTIHAFCLKLLTDYGHYLGLAAPLDLLNNDDELWSEFVQTQTRIGHSLGEKERADLFRLVPARDLMELARRAGSSVLSKAELTPRPPMEFDEIHAQRDAGKSNTVAQSQAELREWERRYQDGWEFLRWPVCFSTDGSKFTQLWREKFAPLRQWICQLATHVAAEVQHDYREFRLERGLVTYPDQIALARELLQHPEAARRLREENLRVILDEAQDTEPAQFEVLLETARPSSAEGSWMKSRVDPPQPGHFCMVGDFQQSIYRDRADLPYYRAVHEALVADAHGESLEFSVTFRLDQKQLDFVNATFREILNDENGQVRFVELQPRPIVLPGKVVRVSLSGAALLPEGKKLKDYQKARIEADYLARWIKQAGFQKLGADSWREVAILCPRKAWLQTMAAALRREQLPVVIQSERDVKGDSPVYAWLAALLTIMTDPRNAYEIVGVLREILGVSDHDLALFSEAQGFRFRIDKEIAATGKVGSHLHALGKVRREIEGLALFDAVVHIAKGTQLRERLLLLPVEEFGDLSRELDALFAQAAEAEASGLILSEFAERLREDFANPRNVRFAADDNAIQLITSHKAKGSEWQCVLLPFLAREMRPPSASYPHFVASPSNGELLLALGKEDKSKELKNAIELAQAQELERLLYVATTRACRTLVLVLDQEIFHDKDLKLLKTAQLRRLVRGGDVYADEFDAHSEIADEVGGATSEPAPTREPAETERIPERELKQATQRASDFVIKITPSAFGAEPLDTSTRIRSRLDNQATLYGSWWHSLLQRIDWRQSAREWEPLFQDALPHASDPERAAAEWALFREYVSSARDFRKHLIGAEIVARSEIPFLLPIGDKAALEGIIDIALFDPAADRALIIDWKTNRVTGKSAAALRDSYKAQIASYWKALTEITGLRVEAGLYASSTGEFLLYPEGELAAEWSRLEGLPASRLAAAVETP